MWSVNRELPNLTINQFSLISKYTSCLYIIFQSTFGKGNSFFLNENRYYRRDQICNEKLPTRIYPIIGELKVSARAWLEPLSIKNESLEYN